MRAGYHPPQGALGEVRERAASLEAESARAAERSEAGRAVAASKVEALQAQVWGGRKASGL